MNSRSVGMVFHHYLWPHVPKQTCQNDLKNILTHLLRHTWPEVVMDNHIHTSAVHGKSFHKGLTKQSLHQVCVLKCINFEYFGYYCHKKISKNFEKIIGPCKLFITRDGKGFSCYQIPLINLYGMHLLELQCYTR